MIFSKSCTRLQSNNVVLWALVSVLLTALSVPTYAESPAKKRKVLIDTTAPTTNSAGYAEPVAAEGAVTPMSVPVVIRVTGYGAYASEDKKSSAKRLLAIRASKLDAYRNLAERVYGFSVSGESTVRDFMLKSDAFATSVDTVVRGARVVSISDNPVTGIETVVELELPGDFQTCLNKVNNFKYRSDCLRPMTHSGLQLPSTDQIKSSSAGQSMRSLYHLD